MVYSSDSASPFFAAILHLLFSYSVVDFVTEYRIFLKQSVYWLKSVY